MPCPFSLAVPPSETSAPVPAGQSAREGERGGGDKQPTWLGRADGLYVPLLFFSVPL